MDPLQAQHPDVARFLAGDHARTTSHTSHTLRSRGAEPPFLRNSTALIGCYAIRRMTCSSLAQPGSSTGAGGPAWQRRISLELKSSGLPGSNKYTRSALWLQPGPWSCFPVSHCPVLLLYHFTLTVLLVVERNVCHTEPTLTITKGIHQDVSHLHHVGTPVQANLHLVAPNPPGAVPVL